MHYLYSTLAVALMLAGGALADLHNVTVCVTNRKSAPIGGTGWSRNTGNKRWDKCPDCTFDGLGCNSAGWHIGGDEMNYYCSKKCGAQGSEAN
ncbi:hypothetical protein HYQ46_002851 [Verticillium longisporum]|nr:hypothetical protein HYQ46_002851 [Verticillium longisporum]